MEPIGISIDGVFDLHTFQTKEIPDLLQDYLSLCLEKGIFRVHIIHGKGHGILKARIQENGGRTLVHKLLRESFS